MKAQAEA
jgi:colicin import membrane protein